MSAQTVSYEGFRSHVANLSFQLAGRNLESLLEKNDPSLEKLYLIVNQALKCLGYQLQSLSHRESCSSLTNCCLTDLLLPHIISQLHTFKDPFICRVNEKNFRFSIKLSKLAQSTIKELSSFFKYLSQDEAPKEDSLETIMQKIQKLEDAIISFEKEYISESQRYIDFASADFYEAHQAEASLPLLKESSSTSLLSSFLSKLEKLNNLRPNSYKTFFSPRLLLKAYRITSKTASYKTLIFIRTLLITCFKKIRTIIKKSCSKNDLKFYDITKNPELSQALEEFETLWKDFSFLEDRENIDLMIQQMVGCISFGLKANLLTESEIENQDPELFIKLVFLCIFQELLEKTAANSLYSQDIAEKFREQCKNLTPEEQKALIQEFNNTEKMTRSDLFKTIQQASQVFLTVHRKDSSFIFKYALLVHENITSS